MEKQTEFAARMYDARAAEYDDSHHPRFARWIVDYLAPKESNHILDLAAGTGLVTFAAAKAVGPTGSVTSIDISTGMQSEARREYQRLRDAGARTGDVTFHIHDIVKLDEIEELRGRKFDGITCASALVLLEDPILAIRAWAKYLKPGARLVVDVTQITEIPSGIALERVSARLGIPPASWRIWVQNEGSFRDMLEAAGLVVEEIVEKEQVGFGTKTYSIEDGEKVWDDMISKEPGKPLRAFGDRAKAMFLEDWKLLADKNGQIIETDEVFVCKAIKPDDSPPPESLLRGSCACRAARWQAWAPPIALNHCCCEPCRKQSGAAYITFLEFPKWAVTFSPRLTELGSVALTPNARRTFCKNCASTLTFQHYQGMERLEVAMGSLDEDGLEAGALQNMLDAVEKSWDWLRSKPSWFEVPNDGLKRLQTMTADDKMAYQIQ